MKYKLINRQTGREHLCDKVTIGGFDYYVSEYQIKQDGQYCIDATGVIFKDENHFPISIGQRMIVATTNPSIDAPKVVDEVEILAFEYYEEVKKEYYSNGQKALLPKSNKEFQAMGDGFIEGYNKSQETHPFSEEDMKSFGKFCIENNVCQEENRYYQYWELLQLWKEQQPKVIYYNTITQ